MKNLFIWIGEGSCPNPEVYNCNYCITVKKYHINVLKQILFKYEKAVDSIVIHFDGFYLDFLDDMVSHGKVTNKYQIRIHNVDEGMANLFYNYRNKYWLDQRGWFER